MKDLNPELESCVRVLELGAEKYGRMNWKEGLPDEDFFIDAIYRHLAEYHRDKKLDSESKQHHLAHVVINCLFQMYYDELTKKL